MNIILLSGGSGTRLWPLSNELKPKQFLKVLEGHESMIQRMYRGIKSVCNDANIVIATSINQLPQIYEQLGNTVNVCVEPCRRDTFPAIALSCALLKDNGIADSEPVIVCPVDSFVDDDYFKCLMNVNNAVCTGRTKLTLMGTVPTFPSEKYGYILFDGDIVTEFKEKPNKEKAQEYIQRGALWNAGVFGFKLGYLLDVVKREYGINDYNKLYCNYSDLKKISFDYAVLEHEKNIGFIKYCGAWKDLGTWNTLTEAMSKEVHGNVVSAYCENTHIINELSIPLISIGIKNAVIVATPDGILVSDKDKSSELKKYINP